MLFHCKLQAVRAFVPTDITWTQFCAIYGRIQPGGQA